jgi:hypothetical protein
MDRIVDKLKNMREPYEWNNWTREEKQKLLELYLIISKKEGYIFDLIYRCHQCDTWEDIFRDYSLDYLQEKENGVKDAIECIRNDLDSDSEGGL